MADTTPPVTVTVARQVAPGREIEFEDWAGRLTAEASRFAGFLGAGLLRPGHAGDPWHVVYRFDAPGHLAAWEDSPVRATVLGMYPLQLAAYALLAATAAGWPAAARLAVSVPLVAASMAWLVMPRLARMLTGWLYPRR